MTMDLIWTMFKCPWGLKANNDFVFIKIMCFNCFCVSFKHLTWTVETKETVGPEKAARDSVCI